MRITVIVSKDEYDEIRRRAGLVPLSAYIKSEVLRDGKEVDQDVRRVAGGISAGRGGGMAVGGTGSDGATGDTGRKVGKGISGAMGKVRTCAHGTEKGYNCWQCGGLAVVNG